MDMRCQSAFFSLLLLILAGPAGATVSLKPHTDFKPIKRTALLPAPDAEGLRDSGLMLTDMLAGHLTEAGLELLPRTTQQAYFDRTGIEVSLHASRTTLQTVGKGLGVDAVVIGRIQAEVENSEVGTMSSRRKTLVRRNGRFVQVWKEPELGPGGVQYFHTDAPVTVHLTIKMIKVDTGEILWFFSSEKRKRGFPSAVRAALDPPMRKIKSAIRRSLRGDTYKPKERRKWRGLDKGWDDRHERGRF